jgi:hypothetical protein
MGLLEAFKFKTSYNLNSQLPDIYPFGVEFNFFVKSDIINIYSKILTDCLERTQGLNDKIMPAFWDNCLESESNKGLISLLAEAMECKSELFLVYKLGVLRKATNDETFRIREDYRKKGSSSFGIYVSFKCLHKSDMLRIYSSMEYSVLNSLNKSMNLSKAIQLKMAKLRDTVGAVDSQLVIDQAKSVANGLKSGCDVLLDAEDKIETAQVDMDATEKAIAFLDAKRCFYLDLPLSYITGEQTGGIGSTGEADAKAVERGLRHYYLSILKPVIEALFSVKTTFKSNDFRQIASALEAIKTFSLVGEDLITIDMKRLIVSKLLDIDESEMPKGEPVNDNPVQPQPVVNQNSAQNQN